MLADWKLAVTFNDGLSGMVDMCTLVHQDNAGVFKPLRDVAFFESAYLEYGAVTWPNGADISPLAMYKAIKRDGIWQGDDELC
ncbi:DUF2442 domain-containing protein [Candidatus Symbiobacter mobilis]|uniref:DUF2442 domain-containing protein n=1 Tax=Candidatus Symbiobacter mobilis TaxID=1436290 RepID=UPI001930A461|nr:DUF2442 domain-containing protein [Candidatus Symbiobacter mobilis]